MDLPVFHYFRCLIKAMIISAQANCIHSLKAVRIVPRRDDVVP